MQSSRLIRIFVLAAGLLPVVGFASPLRLEEAVVRALASHPALRAEELDVQAAEKRADLAALSPPVTIGGELENVAGSGDFRGVDSAEMTLRVGRVIELGRKRELRREAGAAAVNQDRNTRNARQLGIIADTTRRYWVLVGTQEILALRNANLQLARDNAEAVDYRVTRSRASESDRVLADLDVVRAELSREDAQHEMSSARVALSVLWGDTTAAFGDASDALEPLPPLPTWETLIARLQASPGLLGYALEDKSLAAQGSLVRAQRIPDLTASLGVRRLEATADQALVLSLSVPVGLRSRASIALDENQLQRSALNARRDAARLESHQLLDSSYRELEHASHELVSLRDEMIPRAEKALQIAQRGYEDARLSFLDLVQVRALLLSLQAERINAATRYHRLLADIQQLTALSGESTP